tara:strand:+ start:384 stop:596 length:213 start_codon:yes stop_codon:yes gene_type:complete
MLLIHTSRMMDVSIDLSDIVEISMRHPFAVCHLLIFIEKNVKVELAFQILQATECETLAWSIGRNVEDVF